MFLGRTHGFVDFSEDVSSKDLEAAVAEGYDSAELAKRFTTATMGPLQGKLETVNTVAAVAKAAGGSIAETGTTTWRPPYAPVTLAALAGQAFEPVRYSPMQPWHEAHGAVPLIAGAWIRPDGYGDPPAEARNVRENVGIIDVTPIGKLDLRGPDVPRLLNLLYVNKWSKLEIGRVRYGVMCAEDGVVFDDGVTGRLGEEHYLMSTTSSGAAAVWEWAENWLQTEHPDWRVHVTPVTTAYASINVAGPKSRRLIERVTEGVDLANEAFPYMHVRTGVIAGVGDSVLWRIGFTGELSYEIHVPAGYGLHVWETLLAAGADLGVEAFGVEAQRILRLEKGHFIVGQDTDGLTRAFSAGLDWAIKLDKDDFAGKPELAWQLAQGIATKLVGLQPVRLLDRAGGGQPDRRREHDRWPDHLQPDVTDPAPVHLPGPGRGAPRRARNRGHGAAAQRPPDRGAGHPAACARRSGRGEDACLNRKSLLRRPGRFPRSAPSRPRGGAQRKGPGDTPGPAGSPSRAAPSRPNHPSSSRLGGRSAGGAPVPQALMP